MRSVWLIALASVALVTTVAPSAGIGPAVGPGGPEPVAPIPVRREADPQRVSLGEELFYDARLSSDRGRSCATCHPLEHGGMDGMPRALTANGTPHPRNTPTVFNVGLSSFFNWDGIADTLEAHADTVLRSPKLMNITWPELLARLGGDQGYAGRFRAAYADGLNRANVLDALASFERSLETPHSRFDQYLNGERRALTVSEQRGYTLFKAYGCATCHQGVNVGGNMFQRFGVFPDQNVRLPALDLGRYKLTHVERDRGVFRVPSLRNVAVTGPYFHDGGTASLAEAVDTMARVQLGRTLRRDEIDLIVQFLHTLTGRYRGRPVGSAAHVEQ
jgi:cytochrome c peroxidase